MSTENETPSKSAIAGKPLTSRVALSPIQKMVPVIVVLLAVIFVLSKTPLGKSHQGQYKLDAFAQLPSSADGRVKPLDTVARNSLQIISNHTTFKVDGKRQPAIRWLIDLMARPSVADDYKIFRIDHPDVLSLIGIHDQREKYFSFNQILAHQKELTKQAQAASQVPSRKRNVFQKHLMELWSHLELYMSLAGLEYPYLVPPGTEHKEWRQFDKVVSQTRSTGEKQPAAAMFSSILYHYQTREPDKYNTDMTDYQNLLDKEHPKVLGQMGFEVFFNQLEPFYLCVVLYVAVFFLAWFSFLMRAGERSPWAESLGKAAFWLAVFTFAIHTFGLASRVYLQGRPPVTNLYSSAVFIGWLAVLISLVIELPFRLSIGTLLASVIGFTTLIVAMNLAEGDTMEMMQAVLDSNFWLSTHVVVVTAGYSATFLAGLIGVMYILLGTTTKIITPELNKVLTRMVYGVVCFALLLSFTGTVLGGIWADQSWGRFWGWDPKENGAVLIVIWNALILHARWGGMVKTRGIMMLVVFGNIVTAWSWFGTNMLGVGLHSYGFMQSAVFWLALFMFSQLGIILVAFLPLEYWKSFAPSSRKTNTKAPTSHSA